jgi:hypothetical protein
MKHEEQIINILLFKSIHHLSYQIQNKSEIQTFEKVEMNETIDYILRFPRGINIMGVTSFYFFQLHPILIISCILLWTCEGFIFLKEFFKDWSEESCPCNPLESCYQ